MISFYHYSQLWFYYAKLFDTPDEDRHVLWFLDAVVDSDDKDNNIFEPERGFSGVFNTFVNQWC